MGFQAPQMASLAGMQQQPTSGLNSDMLQKIIMMALMNKNGGGLGLEGLMGQQQNPAMNDAASKMQTMPTGLGQGGNSFSPSDIMRSVMGFAGG